jgi:hypothetical protein
MCRIIRFARDFYLLHQRLRYVCMNWVENVVSFMRGAQR